MIEPGSSIKESYHKYLRRIMGTLVSDIPVERRKSLAEEIRVRANLLGCQNEGVLKAALNHLIKEVK